ncbi:PHB depolymerase family esterase [Fluviicola taffensis]|uniref:alpha/beta hydrolase n=1 Tax=Fluviicola taffensis TaxID=191579 RepID=UPI003137F057
MIEKYNLVIAILLTLVSSCKAQNSRENMESNTGSHYVIRESSDCSEKSPMLILLHGHGGNENDLFAFEEQIPLNWIVVSVRGPYKLAENSYRWYDAKLVDGKIVINIEEEEKSRKQIVVLISELTKKYNVDSSKVIVAGFSQGANMAQSIGLCNPNLLSGFAVFSGRYVEEVEQSISKSPNLKNLKAFISHGKEDTMLPIRYAIENQNKLNKLGIKIEYTSDYVGHSISSKEIIAFRNWLSQM